jgi:ubiquinone/menaquinone biosynthesis C-methylase UbiE
VAYEDHVEAARQVYDAAAERYVQFVGTEIGSATEGPVDRALLTAFIELVEGGTVASVADVGCGPGRVAALLAAHGLDVVGVDVSEAMLSAARAAHPDIRFVAGRLDHVPIETETLAGVVCWYSIIYTPPDRLAEVVLEMRRILMPGGCLLLAFQAGDDESARHEQAHGTNLPLTSFRHRAEGVGAQLEAADFEIYANVLRSPDLAHETTPQAFVLARRPRR